MQAGLIFAAAQGVSALSKGMAERARGMTEAAQMEEQALLADTQALQRDTIARDELSRFLGGVASARAANGLSGRSPNAMAIIEAANKQMSSDRIVQTSNDRQRARNFRSAAIARRKGARMSLLTGAVSAAVPIAQGFL